MPIVLESLNLATAERQLCEAALNAGGSIVEAANLLGITRHALKRRIIKHQIQWPPARPANTAPAEMTMSVSPSPVTNRFAQ